MNFIQANSANFKRGSNKKVEYIVIHYTGNNGDTALGNCNYFKNNITKTSANYFVDENSIYQSVSDSDIAYHCGANSYIHPKCRNSNSIGVELCSRKDSNGIYFFKSQTVDNAAALVSCLMQKYNVPIDNVIRHYDVTGKICPEPFVKSNVAWTSFKDLLKKENNKMTVDEAKKILTEKVGLSEQTIQFLYNYRWGDDLLIKIATAVRK